MSYSYDDWLASLKYAPYNEPEPPTLDQLVFVGEEDIDLDGGLYTVEIDADQSWSLVEVWLGDRVVRKSDGPNSADICVAVQRLYHRELQAAVIDTIKYYGRARRDDDR